MSDRQAYCTRCGRRFRADRWSVSGAGIAVGVAVAVALILVGVGVDLVVRRSAAQSASEAIAGPQGVTTAGGRVPVPWEISLPTGRISLRTTAFEVMGLAKSESGRWRPTQHFDKGEAAVIRLVVELSNDSDQSAVLESLKIAALGQVTLREDQSPQIISLINLARPDLGRMACSLTTYHRQNASFTDDNLLAGADTVVLAAHTSRSYHIWLTCRMLMRKLAIFCGAVTVIRKTTDSLAGLDAMDPVVVGAAHVFTAIAEVTADGRRDSLCSDRVYAVVPDSPPHTARLTLDPPAHGVHFLRDSYSLPPERFVRRIVDWSVKSYAETLAYEVAVKTKAVPAGFDPNAISPNCYSGDRDSPLRDSQLQRRTIVTLDRWSPCARSDIVSVLLSIRKQHLALWSVMETEIVRLCAGDEEDRLARKARYVRKELMRQAERAKMWP